MAILITSPGLVTTGTEGADDIRFITGANVTGNASTINGLGGSDTIQTFSGFQTYSGASYGAGAIFNAGGGADSVSLSVSGGSTSANNVVVNGGAGRDTITFVANAAGALVGDVKGGDGGDLITLGTAVYSGVGGGAGLDTVELSGATLATGKSIALGAGTDVISGLADDLVIVTGAGIYGGGGADTITINNFGSANGGHSGAFINGDTTSDGGAADVITVSAAYSGTIIRGKGGADTIALTELSAATVAGNAGKDKITLADYNSGAVIQGGQGGDSIILTGTYTTTAASVVAGGGNDTITLSASVNSGLVMDLGAGADLVQFSGGAAADDLGVLRIGALTDSTSGTIDNIKLSGGIVADAAVDMDVTLGSAIGFASASVLTASTALTATDGTNTGFLTGVGQGGDITNGTMTFSGEASATLATAMTYADKATRVGFTTGATAAQGRAITFEASGVEYFFIQGGSAGTDDDYVIKLEGVSASTITDGSGTLNIAMEVKA